MRAPPLHAARARRIGSTVNPAWSRRIDLVSELQSVWSTMKLKNSLVIALTTMAACGQAEVDPLDAPDAEVDAAAAPIVDVLASRQPTPACALDITQCLYQPPVLPIELLQLTATDPDSPGGPRTVNIAIRYSRMAPRPLPIVVWSHGGASGQTNAVTALDKWAIAAAEAGYLSVAIAHTPRDQLLRNAVCALFNFDGIGCSMFKYLSYDRPHDIAIVIDKLEALSTQPMFAGKLDLTKIAVGGHSAGAGGTLMVDGAAREINHTTAVYADPRPIAFLAFSPQAPGSDGMTEAGYALVARPTLIGTGRGDDNPPDTADGRASVYDLVQPGNKARIFIEDLTAIHTVFALETDTCVNNTTLAHCEEMRDWVRSAGIAFLDANVRALPSAVAWIASSNLAVASGGIAQWRTR